MRHASIERRQQLKWLLTGCVITLASGVISLASGLVPAISHREQRSIMATEEHRNCQLSGPDGGNLFLLP